MKIDATELKQTLTKHLDTDYYKDKKICYNSNSSFKTVKETILSSYYVQQYNILPELVEIICKFIPFDIFMSDSFVVVWQLITALIEVKEF